MIDTPDPQQNCDALAGGRIVDIQVWARQPRAQLRPSRRAISRRASVLSVLREAG